MSKGEKESRVPKLRFKGFTDDWMQEKLENLASDFDYGLNAAAQKYDGVNKYLRITDIDEVTRIFKTNDIKSPTGKLEGKDSYLLAENDIVFARTGASVGKTYLYNSNDGKVYFAGYLIRIRVNKFNSPLFIFYNTLTAKYKNFVQITSVRSGQPGINSEEYKKYKIYVPSLDEQNKIGSFLLKLDKIITLEQEKLFHYKKLREDLLQKIFPRKNKDIPEWRFEGFNDNWKVERLGDIGIIQTGNTPRTSNQEYYDENGLLWVTPTDIKNMNIKDTKKKISKEGCKVARIAPKGSILITSIASIGKNALTTEKVAFNQQINALIPNNENNSYFLFIQSKFWSEHMKRVASTGTMQIINKSEFSKILTTVPTSQEQEKIGKLFKQIDKIVVNKQAKLEKYTCTKNILLKNLFV